MVYTFLYPYAWHPAFSFASCFMVVDRFLTALSAAGYLTTMFGTLYAALVMHSYIMSVVCCILQVRLVHHLSIHCCVCHCHVDQSHNVDLVVLCCSLLHCCTM